MPWFLPFGLSGLWVFPFIGILCLLSLCPGNSLYQFNLILFASLRKVGTRQGRAESCVWVSKELFGLAVRQIWKRRSIFKQEDVSELSSEVCTPHEGLWELTLCRREGEKTNRIQELVAAHKSNLLRFAWRYKRRDQDQYLRW